MNQTAKIAEPKDSPDCKKKNPSAELKKNFIRQEAEHQWMFLP